MATECGTPDAVRGRALALLERFGSNSAAFAIRYPAPWRTFLARSAEGAVCYLESGRTSVVWADPLCAPHDVATVLGELTRELRASRRRACLVQISGATARAAAELGYGVLKIGEDPSFDLDVWRRPSGRAGKTLRGKVNRARRAGVRVARHDGDDAAELEALERRWARALGRAIPNSILQPMPLREREVKRIFVARHAGRVVALQSCSPLYGVEGWLLEDLIRDPAAPEGATELLVLETLHQLAADGARLARLGLAPLRGARTQPERRFRLLWRGLRPALRPLDRRYRFDATAAYQQKFAPTRWEAVFVAFLPSWPTLALARDVLAALDL